MGTDCAPFLANLFLFYYEQKYIRNNVKNKYGECLKLNKVFRYIDDLTCINTDGVFEKARKEIYPECMVLNKENAGDRYANVLDINITINEGRLVKSLYDKRDAFNFDIVNFPDLNGNIPTQVGMNTFECQLRRYLYICDRYEDLLNRFIKLCRNLSRKNYPLNRIKNSIIKTLKGNTTLGKFDKTKIQIEADLLNVSSALQTKYYSVYN